MLLVRVSQSCSVKAVFLDVSLTSSFVIITPFLTHDDGNRVFLVADQISVFVFGVLQFVLKFHQRTKTKKIHETHVQPTVFCLSEH